MKKNNCYLYEKEKSIRNHKAVGLSTLWEMRKKFKMKASIISTAGLLSLGPYTNGQVSNGLDSASTNKPNILFILTDDQRFSAWHNGGEPEFITPTLDKLASQGMCFNQATIMGGLSPAVCSPSRAQILTGRGVWRSGTQGCRLFGWNVSNNASTTIDKDAVTLPQLLREDGYETFCTGKWHNDTDALLRSFSLGSDIFIGGMGDHFNTPVYNLSGGSLVNEHICKTFDAHQFADDIIAFLNSHKQGTPFFAYLSFKTPHDPRVVPPQFHKMYKAEEMMLPKNFLPKHPFDNGEMNVRDEQLAATPRIPDEIRNHIAAYAAATSATDAEIGRILETLDKLGLSKNTIVVFTSDNGLAVGQHGLMGKQNLYDCTIRVPLIIKGPGIPSGTRTGALCYLFDLYPTLTSMVGVKTPIGVEGKDLSPIIRGEKISVRDTTLHVYNDVQASIRTHALKLIEYNVNGVRTTQLFDLSQDPFEIHNLSDSPVYEHDIRVLRQKMKRLEAEYNKPQSVVVPSQE